MRWPIGILMTLFFIAPAWAGQVCVYKSGGELLEYQSHATPGTCTRNAINAGIDPTTIREKQVTDKQWDTIRDKWIDKPARDKAALKKVKRDAAIDKIRQATGLTAQEIKDAFGR